MSAEGDDFTEELIKVSKKVYEKEELVNLNTFSPFLTSILNILNMKSSSCMYRKSGILFFYLFALSV